MVAPHLLLPPLVTVGLLVLQLPRLPSRTQFCAAALGALFCLLLLYWLLHHELLHPRQTGRGAIVGDSTGASLPGSKPRKRLRWGFAFTTMALVLLTALLVLAKAVHWQSHQLPAECDRRRVTIDGVIQGLVTAPPGYGNTLRFDVQVAAMTPAECVGPELIRVYLDIERASEDLQRAPDGSLERDIRSTVALRFDARLRRPWGLVNPFAQHGERMFLVTGHHAVGSVATLRTLSKMPPDSQWSLMHFSSVREAASAYVQTRVPGEVGALLAALAVGDRRGITPEMWTRLRVNGITHLMIISGMHITLIAVPGWVVGSVLRRVLSLRYGHSVLGARLGPLSALTFAGVYAALSGFGLPSQRALLLLAVVLVPQMLGRRVHRVRALSIALLGLFALNPLSLIAASYWLTAGAVSLLLWFSTWNRPQGWLRELWSAQGYMMFAMLPMSLFWFQTASGIGGVLNLLAIPLVTIGIVPLLMCSLLFAPVAESVSTVLLQLPAGLLSLLWSAMGHWQPMLTGWSLFRGSPSLWVVVFALAGVLLAAMPRFYRRWLVISLLFVPLLIALPREHSDLVKLVFFDVGQGTSVLINQGDSALLYDTGGGAPGGVPAAARSVVPMLYARGIANLDTLVISHPDQDHAGGEPLILEVAPPNTIRRGVYDNGTEGCRLGEARRFSKDIVLQVLSQRVEGDSDNNASCVLLLSIHGYNILLPGDIDSTRERDLLAYWGQSLQSDILLAGHHGSAGSNSRLWLRSVAPRLIIVTAGRANRFGHPAPRVGDLARDQGAVLVNTASHGAVTLRISPQGGLSCEASRHRWSPFWRKGDANQRCLPPQQSFRRYNHDES